MTSLPRRDFLAAAGVSTAALAAGAWTRPLAPAVPFAAPKALPIGIELYAVRKELARDLSNTLQTVAKLGYQVVEFYAPYLSWTIPYAKEVRTQLDDLGVRCYSTHNGFSALTPGETMTKAIEINQILGARHIVLASPPSNFKTVDEWKRFCGQLASASEQLAPHGLSAGFHNHHAEWLPVEGQQRAMDVIAEHTPSNFVLQLDVGTCVQAGADPVAWIRAHPGRIRSLHLKDWSPGTEAQEKAYRVLFGEGVAPWKAIFDAAESVGGAEYYLMEQEGSRFSEFETAERCLASWRALQKSRA